MEWWVGSVIIDEVSLQKGLLYLFYPLLCRKNSQHGGDLVQHRDLSLLGPVDPALYDSMVIHTMVNTENKVTEL